mmetsp:Transcript_14644/g.26608  ORF Transcript_14644/g.26608 Transcript_14644/m.26608 type:complete len:991 (-) Transcript_14644:277-3249(-)
MDASISTGNGSDGPVSASKADELSLMIENNSRIQAIVSAHRDEVLSMFMADAPASKMVALRMENLCAMKSSMAPLESKLSSTLPSVLQELLVKSEEEAMRLFQIVSAHRDEALEMFKTDAPASRMVALRMEHLSAMKSSMALPSTPPSVLQEYLVKSEEEAMQDFQNEHLVGSNSSMKDIKDSGQIDFRHNHDVGFEGEEMNGLQDNTAAECKNDDLVEDELSPYSKAGEDNASPSTNSDNNSLDEESSYGSNDDDGLSDYERLRLRNIEKNQARLAQLGLLTNNRTTASASGAGRASSSALTNLLASNSKTGTRHAQKKKQTVPTPQRSLPRRLCRAKLKQDFSYNDPLNDDFEGSESGASMSASHGDCEKKNSLVLNYEDCSPPASEHSLIGEELKKPEADALLKSLVGIRRKKNGGNYEAKISYQGAPINLGMYKLATDATLAHDKAVRLLKGQRWRVNFAMDKDYKDLRAKESNQIGLDVDLEDALAAIKSKLNAIASKKDVSVYKASEEDLFKSLTGFHRRVASGDYQAMIRHQGKQHCLGTYKLACDAAMAYDGALKILKGSRGINFVTTQEHIDMLEKEMRSTGLDVDLEETLAMISGKVKKVASKIGKFKDKAVSMAVAKSEDDEISKSEDASAVIVGQDAMDAESESEDGKSDHLSAGAALKKLDEDAIFKSLRGFSRKATGGYRARVCHNGKEHDIGRYKLRSDAAFAYDEAARALEGRKRRKVNFESKQAHRTLRANELKRTGFNVDLGETLAVISWKVKEVLSKIGKTADPVVGRLDQKESVGYSITEDALAAIESNVKDIVSKTCSLEDSAVALDTHQHTSPSLTASKNPGSKRVDSTKSSTKSRKRVRESSLKCSSASAPKKSKNAVSDPADKERIVAAIVADNTVYGDRSLTSATLCGVTMQQDKWQAQLYYAGKPYHIGVFDSKEKASLAYHIAREVLKTDTGEEGPANPEDTDWNVALVRKAAFTGVDEQHNK